MLVNMLALSAGGLLQSVCLLHTLRVSQSCACQHTVYMSAGGGTQDWAKLTVFARMAFLRSLLDGTASREEVNRAVWQGISLIDNDSTHVSEPLPDVFSDPELQARLDAEEPMAEELQRAAQ